MIHRGLRGVEYIVSDNHSGLTAALRSTLTNARWQRCQFHLSQNAIHHCPSDKIKKRIGSQLRPIYESSKPEQAQTRLKELVAEYEESSPKLAQWLESNIPEGLAVLSLPGNHRKRMRTSNGIERPIQQELKRRTRKIRIFPNTDSLLRLCTAILIEIDDEWTASTYRYLTWQTD